MDKETDGSFAGADALVARAMTRALDAERAAQEAIAESERQAADGIEHARQQRRSILERARDRIVALHNRTAGRLERQAAEIVGKASPAVIANQLSNPTQRGSALIRLAARLTTENPEQPADGH